VKTSTETNETLPHCGRAAVFMRRIVSRGASIRKHERCVYDGAPEATT
jgi:hypothetical protein